MSVNRRSVLKGITLGSFAGWTMSGSLRALAGGAAPPAGAIADEPLLALVNEDTAGSVFLQGAAAASGARLQAQRVGRDLAFILNFGRQLRSSRPLRVIGLLDTAAATLVVDQARSAGARVQWLGQHTAEPGYTRHRVLDTDVTRGWSSQLGRELEASGAGFHIIEERPGSPDLPRQMSAPARTSARAAEWVSGIGYLLASLHAQPGISARGALGTRPVISAGGLLDAQRALSESGPPAAPPALSAQAPLADIELVGSFVSFSIEA